MLKSAVKTQPIYHHQLHTSHKLSSVGHTRLKCDTYTRLRQHQRHKQLQRDEWTVLALPGDGRSSLITDYAPALPLSLDNTES